MSKDLPLHGKYQPLVDAARKILGIEVKIFGEPKDHDEIVGALEDLEQALKEIPQR